MFGKPVIFISAVSKELHGARDLVAKTLASLGYEAKWQDIAPAEAGDLRGVLRKWVDDSAAVIQLVGQRYGCEPAMPDAVLGRISYTQFEAIYARQREKKVWYLILAPEHPTEAVADEPPELHALQETYRQRVTRDGHQFHHSASLDQTERVVLRLRDDLGHLHRRTRQVVTLVLMLLAVCVALGALLVKSGHDTEQKLTVLQEEMAKLRQGVNQFATVQAQVQVQQPGQKPEQFEDRTYEELARQLGVDAKKLRAELPSFARQLQHAPDASAFERANAAFVAKDYAEAERLALEAAGEAEKAVPPQPQAVIKAYELAGRAAQERIHYADALRHLREAERRTDRKRDPAEWARVQCAIAKVLDDNGDYRQAGAMLKEVVREQTGVLGAKHPDVLLSRIWFAMALLQQGQWAASEAELRKVIELENEVQGPEHADTLKARNNLANALYSQGKSTEAEQEYRAVLAIRERVFGPEHPQTLTSRMNLANALDSQGKSAEAEQEHRAVLAIRERVLGPEHPDTLMSRMNLAIALRAQGKHTEAEQEHRAVLAIRERVLGPEHPDVFLTCYNLSGALQAQKRFEEALGFAKRAEEGWKRVLGEQHPDYKDAVARRKEIEAEMKKGKAGR